MTSNTYLLVVLLSLMSLTVFGKECLHPENKDPTTCLCLNGFYLDAFTNQICESKQNLFKIVNKIF